MIDTDELRKMCDTIRVDALRMTTDAASGHPSSCFSCVEIIGVVILDIMDIDPDDPTKFDRDRFVLSKGHAAPAYYSALSLKGFIPREELYSLRAIGSRLQGHPDMNKTPGVDFSTGSLGMGLSVANGMALACRLNKASSRIYVLLGDGELQEGQIWEAAMTAGHHKLSNVIAIVDRNKLQCDGLTEDIKSIEPLDAKFKAFGWRVFFVDGHDVGALQKVIRDAETPYDGPTVIIADTLKGKGVSCMEDQPNWHGKPLKGEAFEQALKECEQL